MTILPTSGSQPHSCLAYRVPSTHLSGRGPALRRPGGAPRRLTDLDAVGQVCGQLTGGLVFAGGRARQPAGHQMEIDVHNRYGLVAHTRCMVVATDECRVDVIASSSWATRRRT